MDVDISKASRDASFMVQIRKSFLDVSDAASFVKTITEGAKAPEVVKEYPFTNAGFTDPLSHELRVAVRAIANECGERSRIISAIKFVRSVTGWGLKESKDYVEGLI